MRLALVIYGSLEQVSGGNLYDQILVKHLEDRGHEVTILSLPHGSYAYHLAQNFSWQFYRQIENLSFDVLLQDELVHPSLCLFNRFIKKKRNCQIVSIVHHLRTNEKHPTWQNNLYGYVEKQYLESVDAFIFNSETTKESVTNLIDTNIHSIVATPGGDRLFPRIERTQVVRRIDQTGPRRLLFVGNLIPRKGLHLLIGALTNLREHEWHLDVVGSRTLDAGYVRKIELQLAKLNLNSRVTLHGSLNGKTLASFYRSSHVFVMPSLYEGFGIVYLEAMAFGLPVIACTYGAVDEIVQNESTGLLIETRDKDKLATSLRRLIKDREILSQLSLKAYDAFDNHSTWEQSMTSVEIFLMGLEHSSPTKDQQ